MPGLLPSQPSLPPSILTSVPLPGPTPAERGGLGWGQVGIIRKTLARRGRLRWQ